MATVRIAVFYEPGTSHIESLKSRAEKLFEHGILEAMPTAITARTGEIAGFWTVLIECTDQDRKVWLGFVEGVSMCVNNRPLMVGTK